MENKRKVKRVQTAISQEAYNKIKASKVVPSESIPSALDRLLEIKGDN